MPESRQVDVPGARLWSVRQGSGPALAVLHGGPGLWDYLGPVAAALEDVATSYRYDQRGCGRSTGDGPYDLATAIADLEAVRAAWGVERWALFGHSWGASLALAYAVAHPDRSRAVVYVSGTGVDPAWHAAYRANREARLPAERFERRRALEPLIAAADGPTRERLVRERSEISLAADLADPSRVGEVVAWLYADGFAVNEAANRQLGADASRVVESAPFAARLRDLAVPTMVMHGAEDPRPARFAATLAELIPGAELVVLPNVGHFPRFEAPAAFGAAVRGFLRGLP